MGDIIEDLGGIYNPNLPKHKYLHIEDRDVVDPHQEYDIYIQFDEDPAVILLAGLKIGQSFVLKVHEPSDTSYIEFMDMNTGKTMKIFGKTTKR